MASGNEYLRSKAVAEWKVVIYNGAHAMARPRSPKLGHAQAASQVKVVTKLDVACSEHPEFEHCIDLYDCVERTCQAAVMCSHHAVAAPCQSQLWLGSRGAGSCGDERSLWCSLLCWGPRQCLVQHSVGTMSPACAVTVSPTHNTPLAALLQLLFPQIQRQASATVHKTRHMWRLLGIYNSYW